jgi:glutamate-1-semialdehyde aminotransferase
VDLTLGDGVALDERQGRHFEALVRRYTARTRRSKEYAARSRPVLADNRASLNFRMATKELLYPVVGERSEGSRLWDVDGNEYVDFTMGFGVHLFGHRPPFVMEAVDEQLRRGVHLGPQSDLAGPAAELFRELTGKERVTFCNTGSEAVMTAVRIARAVTGRRRVVIFAGSYHGCFDGVLARGGDGARPLPIAPGTPPGMIEDVVVLPYGAPAAMEYLRANAGSIAAVLVEAVQSRDPELHPRAFLHELRALTRGAGAALVFDETITGFRLHPAGAQGWYGIEADLATYGKVVGGGFPIGGVAGRAGLMDAIDGGAWSYGDDSYPAAGQTFFAGTFCKHPVAMAAACAVLGHLRDAGPALHDTLNARAGRLVAALRAVLGDGGMPMRIAHCASIFHFRPEPGFRFADLLFHHLVERGIYVWEGRVCYLSTAHTDEDCDRLVRALRESVHALREGGFLPDSRTAAVPAEPGCFVEAEPPPAAGIHSFPLTAAQRAIWARARLGGDASRAYHEQIVIGLRGRLDVAVLRGALDDLARHHEALRTVFAPSGEAQRILSAFPVPLVVGDASGADDEALARAMEDALRGELDLERGPLFRLHAHPRGPDRQVLQLVVHHLVADGVSLGILKRDLEIACRARQAGHAPRLPGAMQFSEYAATLAARAGPSAAREAEWLAGFDGAVPLALPCDRHEPGAPRGAREARTLGGALAAGLREASRREGRTLFMTLLGGMLTVLHRLTGQDDLVIGISSAGRPFPGSASVVGNCAEVLPVRSRIRRPASVGEVMESVRGRVLDAGEHESLSWSRLRETRPLPAVPSFVFNLEPGPPGSAADEAPTFAGLPVERVSMPAPYTKYDATIDVVDSRGELHLVCTFDRARCEPATIARILGDLARVLEQVAEGTAPARESATTSCA